MPGTSPPWGAAQSWCQRLVQTPLALGDGTGSGARVPQQLPGGVHHQLCEGSDAPSSPTKACNEQHSSLTVHVKKTDGSAGWKPLHLHVWAACCLIPSMCSRKMGFCCSHLLAHPLEAGELFRVLFPAVYLQRGDYFHEAVKILRLLLKMDTKCCFLADG